MRKTIHYSLIVLFILLQIFLLFFKEIEVLDYSRYVNQHPLPLFGENKEISQEFRTAGPLARIDVMLANYLTKPKGGTLRLTILDDVEKIFFKNFPADTVEDNRFYSFDIDGNHSKKIPKGNYRLQLSFNPINKTDKLAVWIADKNLYPYGHLYVNGVRRDGDMTFRVYYLSTVWQERDRWLNAVPAFPARSYILGGGFLLLLFMVNLLLHLLLKIPVQDESDSNGTSETH